MKRLAMVCLLLCSCGFGRPAAVAADLTTEQCVRVARQYCREDIALVCQTAHDLIPVIEQLLGESSVGGSGSCAR